MSSVDGRGASRRNNSVPRWLVTLAATGALVTLAAACSGGDDGEEIDPVAQSAAGNGPAGGDVEEVEEVVADLLERHDEVIAEGLANPSVSEDETHEVVGDLRALYTPDNEMPDQIVASWATDAEAGRSTHELEVGIPAVSSSVDGEIETVSETEVRFPLCQVLNLAIYDADGNLIEMTPDREQPGQGTAVRVEGEWLLVQLDTFPEQAQCGAAETEES